MKVSLTDEEAIRVGEILKELKEIYNAEDISLRKKGIYYPDGSKVDYIIDIKGSSIGRK